MRVIVFGYSEVGYVCLEELLAQGANVVAVVTHEDRPGEEIWWRSVADLARQRGIPVYFPTDVNAPEFVATLRGYAPDLLFSFYFRDMLSPEILDLPTHGGLNTHGSLLPHYRGRAPVNWVLVNGETETGVTLHYMVRRADAGDIVAQRRVPIAFADTARTLYDKITVAAQEVIRETWPLLREGRAPRWPQDVSQGSYFGRRTPEDGKIDWHWPALGIYNLIRAVTHPYPGAFTFLEGHKLWVWWGRPLAEENGKWKMENGKPPGTVTSITPDGPCVATGDGELQLLRVQFEGEEERAGEELARDVRLKAGAQMGEEVLDHEGAKGREGAKGHEG